MKIRILLAATLVAASVSLTASAQQQPWIKDRRYGEGMGIRTGNVELHPGVAGEVGYDSNYFHRSGGAREPVIDVIRLRITPSFSLSTLGAQRRSFDRPGAEPPKFDFRGGVSASYNELFAVDGQYSDQASEQRHLSAGANFKLDILPSKPWGGDLYGDFQRTVEPSNDPADEFAFNRDSLRTGAMVVWRPGGGLFDWRLGYEFRYNYFEATAYRNLNNVHHYVKTKGRWRFLPRTALMYDARLGWVRYTNNHPYLNDSSPVRARIGLNGLVTNHFALLAMIGWGASFYSGNRAVIQDFDSIIAQSEVKWFIQPQQRLPEDAARVGLSSIALGYIRDFKDSYLTDYYQRDRGYAKFEWFFAGMVLLSAEAGFAHYEYPMPFFPAGQARIPPGGPYTENRIDANLFAEYRLSDQFGINTTLRYDRNLTDVEVDTDPTEPDPALTLTDELWYTRYQIFLGARWFI